MTSQELVSTITTAVVVTVVPILAGYISMLFTKLTKAGLGLIHNKTAAVLFETLMKHVTIAVAEVERTIVRDAKDPTKTATSWTESVKQDAKVAAMNMVHETGPDLIAQLKVSDKMLGSMIEHGVAQIRGDQSASPTPSTAPPPPPKPAIAPVIPINSGAA
jgi:hypothetical protein